MTAIFIHIIVYILLGHYVQASDDDMHETLKKNMPPQVVPTPFSQYFCGAV